LANGELVGDWPKISALEYWIAFVGVRPPFASAPPTAMVEVLKGCKGLRKPSVPSIAGEKEREHARSDRGELCVLFALLLPPHAHALALALALSLMEPAASTPAASASAVAATTSSSGVTDHYAALHAYAADVGDDDEGRAARVSKFEEERAKMPGTDAAGLSANILPAFATAALASSAPIAAAAAATPAAASATATVAAAAVAAISTAATTTSVATAVESSATTSTAAPAAAAASSSDAAVGLIGERERLERKRKLESDTQADNSEEDAKKRKDMCYRCGGHGHFYALCPSPAGSAEGNGQLCYKCNGKGHIQTRCPNNLPPNACYRCGMVGHRARYVARHCTPLARTHERSLRPLNQRSSEGTNTRDRENACNNESLAAAESSERASKRANEQTSERTNAMLLTMMMTTVVMAD